MSGLDRAAIEKIEELVRAASPAPIDTGDGRKFSAIPLHDLTERQPEPSEILVNTLSGFVEAAKLVHDDDELVPECVIVNGPGCVSLYGILEGYARNRPSLVKARAVVPFPEDRPAPGFQFGRYHAQEDFVIGLQALFVPDEARDAVLRVVGNLTSASSTRLEDDGVTQVATMRAGVTRKTEGEIPNPVTLRPYRTFAEVEQPASKFILRIQEQGGEPKIALFEVEDPRWILTAKTAIKEYLAGQLSENGIVLDVIL